MSHDNAKDNDNGISNDSGNRPFEDVLQTYATRRSVLVGGLALGAASFLPGTVLGGSKHSYSDYRTSRMIGFKPVPVSEGNGPWATISEDYQFDVFIPWGEPIEPGGPAFSWPPSAADQELQIGIGHDGMAFFPLKPSQGGSYAAWHNSRPGNDHGMLAINHEYGSNDHVLGKSSPESLEEVRVSQHAHGVSVLEIKKNIRGQWETLKSDRNRRIHVNTPVAFSGPVAGHELLMTPNGNVPLGTVNNCASGPTPWGTYLTCEENFNGYFAATGDWTATPEQARYGFASGGFGYGWEQFDRRFDLSDADYRNEENRFGWVVEIDPMDAAQKPVKRTALGRIKHEGATTVIGKGNRAVVYMGDDERFDYIYKFVSAGDYKKMLKDGQSPLDEGRLYVARFNDDGTGDWLELTIDNPVLAARFADQAEVLTFARIAGDLLGATPMDRPEWIAVGPDGKVYCTLTNNSKRKVANAANPLAPNYDGHIIRWKDSDKFTGLGFTWDIFIIAQDTHGTEDTFGSPDGLWADPYGRLFIETDGDQKDGLNNQLLVADTRTGALARLFTGPAGCEVTGVAVTPDQRTMFVNIQHPGDGDPSVTNFPAPIDGVTIPRDCTIVITRKDGGIIGS